MMRALKIAGGTVVIALAIVGFLCLLCLAMNDPLTPSPSFKLVSEPNVQVVQRSA